MVYSQVVQIKSLLIHCVDYSVVYYGLQSSSSDKERLIQCVDYSLVYYGLQSSSSDKEPVDTVCRLQ